MSSSEYDNYLQSEQTRYKEKFNQEVIPDGYTHDKTWDSLDKKNEAKICYLMKEPHDADKNTSLTAYDDACAKWLEDRNYGVFYNNFILFSKAIIDTIQGKHITKYNINSLDLEEITQIYKRLSLVNVKKSNGTSDSSNGKFNSFADEFLKKGLIALNPDILVLGGTSYSFELMYPDPKMYYPKDAKQCLEDENGIWWFYFLKNGFDGKGETKLIIDFYHLSSRVNSLLYMLTLNKIVLSAIDYMKTSREDFKNTRLFKVLCQSL